MMALPGELHLHLAGKGLNNFHSEAAASIDLETVRKPGAGIFNR